MDFLAFLGQIDAAGEGRDMKLVLEGCIIIRDSAEVRKEKGIILLQQK